MNRIDEIRSRLTPPESARLAPYRLLEDVYDLAYLLDLVETLERRELAVQKELCKWRDGCRERALRMSTSERDQVMARHHAWAFSMAVDVLKRGGA